MVSSVGNVQSAMVMGLFFGFEESDVSIFNFRSLLLCANSAVLVPVLTCMQHDIVL